MKKIIVFCFLTFISAFITKAATTFTYRSIKYEVISEEEKTCKVTGFIYNDASMTFYPDVPDDVNGYTPIEIADRGFYFENTSGSISSPTLTNNIETIGSYFLGGCYINKFTVPTKLKLVKENAFADNKLNFVTVTINDFEAWCKIDFQNVSSNPLSRRSSASGCKVIVNGEELIHLVVPNTISEIKNFAFYGFNPYSVTFPSSVNLIGEQIFGSATINSVTSLNPIPPIMSSQIFSSATLKNPLYVPKNSVDAYKEAPFWQEFSNIIGIDVETTGISLDKTAISMQVGDSETLSAIVKPEGATDPVVWSSAPENIISVEEGVVKALSVGYGVVTVTSGSYSAVCHVIVQEKSDVGGDTPSSPGYSDDQITAVVFMVPDEDNNFSTLLPDGVTASAWESSNKYIADVTIKGRVDAYEFGRVYIIAKDAAGSEVAVFEVNICPTVTVEHPEGSVYVHHVLYNSIPTLSLSPAKGYEISGVTHDGVDVTDLVATDGTYVPAAPITANSVINLALLDKNSEDGPVSGVGSAAATSVKVLVSGHQVSIVGAPDGEEIKVYNMLGHPMLFTTETTFTLDQSGVYLIKIQADTFKIIIN